MLFPPVTAVRGSLCLSKNVKKKKKSLYLVSDFSKIAIFNLTPPIFFNSSQVLIKIAQFLHFQFKSVKETCSEAAGGGASAGILQCLADRAVPYAVRPYRRLPVRRY